MHMQHFDTDTVNFSCVVYIFHQIRFLRTVQQNPCMQFVFRFVAFNCTWKCLRVMWLYYSSEYIRNMFENYEKVKNKQKNRLCNLKLKGNIDDEKTYASVFFQQQQSTDTKFIIYAQFRSNNQSSFQIKMTVKKIARRNAKLRHGGKNQH